MEPSSETRGGTAAVQPCSRATLATKDAQSLVAAAGMRSLPWITACIALAAIIRMVGSASALLLGVAAACWSLGFLLLMPTLLRPGGGRT